VIEFGVLKPRPFRFRSLAAELRYLKLQSFDQPVILRNEPEAKDCALAIERNQIRRVSAANFVETALVIDGSRDPIASRRFDDLLNEAQIAIEPVTEAQARVAREAYRDFGKGSRHPAKLNFGDCFA
jgi:ribonuclease VapC